MPLHRDRAFQVPAERGVLGHLWAQRFGRLLGRKLDECVRIFNAPEKRVDFVRYPEEDAAFGYHGQGVKCYAVETFFRKNVRGTIKSRRR